MKILITGAYGLLGTKVIEFFSSDNNFEVFGLVRKESLVDNRSNVQYYSVDLIDTDALQKVLAKVNPEIIIHCAANVNLNDCEKNRIYTQQLHVNSSAVLAQSFGLKKYIYISTDSVFNGKNGCYLEYDKPDPLNNYAKTKLEGEMAASENFENTVIIRTNIYGINNSFKNSLAEWAFKSLLKNTSIDGFTDVIFNPVSISQLAIALKIITLSSYKGIINVGSNKAISKYEFLIKIARKLKINDKFVNPVSITKYSSEIVRPLNTSLSVEKLKQYFGIDFSLEEGLNELITEFKDYYYEKH